MDINWKYKNNRYRPVLKKKRKREKEECAEESFEGEPLIPIVNNMNLNPSETICKVDNHIYLYDDITTDSNLKFVKFLREVDSNQQIKFQRGEITEPTIHIHINSNGGSLTDGFSMASTILSCKSNTISYCEGMVASAVGIAKQVSESGEENDMFQRKCGEYIKNAEVECQNLAKGCDELKEKFEKCCDYFMIGANDDIRKSSSDFFAFFRDFFKNVDAAIPKEKKKRAGARGGGMMGGMGMSAGMLAELKAVQLKQAAAKAA